LEKSENLEKKIKMPFKRGFAPIRRTIKYLESSPIIFRERVKVMTIHYNEPQELVTSKKEFPQHEGISK